MRHGDRRGDGRADGRWSVGPRGYLREDGCYTAELAGVEYDPAAGPMAVRIESFSTAEAGEGCAECEVDIEYEATVSYDGPGPGTVIVSHDGQQVTSYGPW